MSEPKDRRAIDRREFLQILSAAGVASLLPAATGALAQAPTPPTTAAPSPATPAAPSEDARALTAILHRRYPERFTESQWESIARDFEGDIALGKRLRAVKFANGDEPDSTFQA